MINAGTAWLSPHDELTITDNDLVWLDLTEFGALMSAVIEQPGVTVWRFDNTAGIRWKIIADREPPCITALGNSRVVPDPAEPLLSHLRVPGMDETLRDLSDKARTLFHGYHFGGR